LFNSASTLPEGALASFLNSALGFSPTLFLALPESFSYWTEFFSLTCTCAHFSFLFLNQDYTEKDEQLINEELIFRVFHIKKLLVMNEI